MDIVRSNSGSEICQGYSAVPLCLLSLAELVMQVIGVKEVDESRAGGE